MEAAGFTSSSSSRYRGEPGAAASAYQARVAHDLNLSVIKGGGDVSPQVVFSTFSSSLDPNSGPAIMIQQLQLVLEGQISAALKNTFAPWSLLPEAYFTTALQRHPGDPVRQQKLQQLLQDMVPARCPAVQAG